MANTDSVADLKRKQLEAVAGAGVLAPQPVTLPTGLAFVRQCTTDTNLAVVRNTASSLQELTVFNGSAATVFVKLYSKASAPVLASDTPAVVIPVAVGAFVGVEFGNVGKRFTSGISLAVTGAAAPTDTTAIGTGVVVSATYL